MRNCATAAILLLAACKAAPHDAAAQDSASVSATTAPAESSSAKVNSQRPDPAVTALLDRLVVPRQAGRFAPRDECGHVPGARQFREALAAAVLAGDADAIAALAVPEVRLGFGGDDGRAQLRRQLAAKDGKLLGEFRKLLELGCAANGDNGLTMPWYFAQDMGAIDSSVAMLVAGQGVPVRSGPETSAPVLETVSWDLVELVGESQPDKPFQQVKAADGTQGYVATGSLRSLLGHRLLAERRGGKWMIVAMVAGD